MDETVDLREVRAESFESAVGDEFSVRDPETVLVLGEVVRYPVQRAAPRSEPFSLVFIGQPGLAQRIYDLEHGDLGRMQVFLVPLGPGRDGNHRYEAAFN